MFTVAASQLGMLQRYLFRNIPKLVDDAKPEVIEDSLKGPKLWS